MLQDNSHSFGEGHHGESFTQFLAQTAKSGQWTRSNSLDKLEVAEENFMKNNTEYSAVNCPVISDDTPQTLAFQSNQLRHVSAGRLRKMLHNKENIQKTDANRTTTDRRKGYVSAITRDPASNKLSSSTSSISLNHQPLIQSIYNNQNYNPSHLTSLKSTHTFIETSNNSNSFIDRRIVGKSMTVDVSSSTNQLKREKEPSLSRDKSRGKLRIDSMGSDSLKDISYNNGINTSMSSKKSDFDFSGFAKSTKAATSHSRKLDKENKIRSDKLKKQPKKIEVSLALDLSNNQSESNLSRTTLKAQQDFADELIKRGEELKEKKRILAEIAEKEEINLALQKERAKTPNRNFGQFLTDQNIYADKKETRIKFAQLKADQERLVNDPIPQPAISRKSKEIVSQKKENDPLYEKEVHIRLYEAAKYRNLLKKNISSPLVTTDETPQATEASFLIKDHVENEYFFRESFNFQPRVNSKSKSIIREERIDSILYKDAIRRQNKSQENIRPRPTQKFLSDQSSKLLAKRLIKEFEEEAYNFFEPNKEHVFSYNEMCEFLRRLHFVKDVQDNASSHFIHQKSLLQILWAVLRGDKFGGVSSRNLLVFLLAIMGLDFEFPASIRCNTGASFDTAGILQLIKTTIASDRDSGWSGMKFGSPMGRFTDIYNPNQNTTTTLRNDREDSSTRTNLRNTLLPKQIKESAQRRNLWTEKTEQGDAPPETPQIQDTSLGISHILTRKFSFQSENPKPTEAAILEDVELDENQIKIGTFDNNRTISFNKEEIARIAQIYDLFYCNRLHSGVSTVKNRSMSPNKTSSKFHPEILDRSRNLANNYRDKQLQTIGDLITELNQEPPANGVVTHADLLIYQGMSTKNKLKKERQKSKERLLDECTFKPKTNAGSRLPTTTTNRYENSYDGEAYNFRGERLYKLADTKAPKIDRSTNEVEFEKSAENCTFQPRINRSAKTPLRSTNRSFASSKDFNKSVERIKKGRERREQVKMLTDARGFNPKDENLPRFKFTLEKPKKAEKRISSSFVARDSTINYADVTQTYGILPRDSRLSSSKKNPLIYNSDMDYREEYDKYLSSITNDKEAIYANFDNIVEEFDGDLKTTNLRKLIDKILEPARAEQKLQTEKSPEKTPLLYVDVNFGVGKSQRIMIYEGDTAEDLANNFAETHNLDDHLRNKLKTLLYNHMSKVLSKIEEEMPSTQSEIERVPPSNPYL